MRKLHGAKLPHRKNTQHMAVTSLPLPERVYIPMAMHIGAPCTPLVKAGDAVLVGQKIGDSDAYMSAPIHSSVSGTVKAITTYRMSNGKTCPMVEIETDGKQTADPSIQPPKVADRAQFLDAIRASGLVGMGGASFPTHVKLAAKQPIDTLLINAAECEPYITSDNRQMLEHPDEVIHGITEIMQWLEIPRAIIGIESNKPEAIRELSSQCETRAGITVSVLPERYPQGAEKVLVYHTTGRMIEEGQLPADQGVLVMNVSSVAFVSRYLRTGMPMVERIVTVDGDAVEHPCNVRVPMGTPIQDLLIFAGCRAEQTKKVLYGGPMMGIAVPDAHAPILKANNAITVLSHDTPPKETACIRCGQCVAACPLRLMPVEIVKAYHQKDWKRLEQLHVTLCMSCGCCSFVCPANRPMAQTNQLAKQALLAQQKIKKEA